MAKNENDEEYNKYLEDPRIPCQYGAKCYQKNPMHHNKYKHPPKTDQKKKKDMKRTGVKRKAADVTNNVKTPPTSPKVIHQDKKEKQTNDPLPECSTSEEKSEKMDDTEASDKDSRDSNRDKLSPSPETRAEAEILDKFEKGAKIENLTLEEKRKTISNLFLTDMPSDFYQLYEFCKEHSKTDPALAFKLVDLKLVGPFDVMTEHLFTIEDKDNYLKHWRYFYDPPEFQTVLKGNDKDGLHFGYWRDDSDKMPVFVAKNNANVSCKITPVAENLFGALDSYLEERIKLANPFEKATIARLHQKLKSFAKERKINLEKYTPGMKERERKVMTRTLHSAGIVVPFDRKTQVGYRKLATNDADLQKMLNKIQDAESDRARNAAMNDLQEVIRWATIAADECDFGTCLELGHDLFSSGVSQVKDMALQMLSIAYGQLDRPHFLKIAQIHLKDRKKGSSLSVF